MKHNVNESSWHFIMEFPEPEEVEDVLRESLVNSNRINDISWYSLSHIFDMGEESYDEGGVFEDVYENGWDMSNEEHRQLYTNIQKFLLGPQKLVIEDWL